MKAGIENPEGTARYPPKKGINMPAENVKMARIYYLDGRIEHYRSDIFAFAIWLSLPKGIRAAFRGKKDARPVYPWDYLDAL